VVADSEGEQPTQEEDTKRMRCPVRNKHEDEELDGEVSPEDACSAARALSISLKELTLHTQDEWLPAIHAHMKKLQVLTQTRP